MKKYLIGFIAGIALGAAGLVFAQSVKIFSDVPQNAYYAKAVQNLSDAGIMTGYSNGNFGPNDNMTRGQVATIIDRYNQQEDQKLADLFMTLQNVSNMTTPHTQVPHSVALILAQAGLFLNTTPPDASAVRQIPDPSIPQDWTVMGDYMSNNIPGTSYLSPNFYLKHCGVSVITPSQNTVLCTWYGPFQNEANTM